MFKEFLNFKAWIRALIAHEIALYQHAKREITDTVLAGHADTLATAEAVIAPAADPVEPPTTDPVPPLDTGTPGVAPPKDPPAGS
jgi:hypothetical protein